MTWNVGAGDHQNEPPKVKVKAGWLDKFKVAQGVATELQKVWFFENGECS